MAQPMFSAQVCLPLEPLLVVLQNSEEGSEFSRGRGYIHIDRPPVSFILYTDFLKGDLASGPDFTVDQLLKLELFIYKMDIIPRSPACC